VISLPFGLVLKMNESSGHTTKVTTLQLLSSLKAINHPFLFHCVFSSMKDRGYMVSTWVDGDSTADVWDVLQPTDLKRMADDLQDQWQALQSQTENQRHPICSAAGGTIVDARVPWIAEERPQVFHDCCVSATEVWLGLDYDIPSGQALRKDMQTVLDTVYHISFCHGDMLPKNFISPGGLARWQEGGSRVCFIDWEQAGWLPIYWDALKTTWVEDDTNSEYT
ncbi:hypothetical protein DFH07DRAFT_694746, partial [Mycena maculata]